MRTHTRPLRRLAAGWLILGLLTPLPGVGWGNEGHRMIHKLGASALPVDVPDFLQSAASANEIEYLGLEPDRWRSRAEPELSAAQAPEHFIDLTTARGIHCRFEGPFVAANIREADVAPKMTAPQLLSGDIFNGFVNCLRHSATLVQLGDPPALPGRQ